MNPTADTLGEPPQPLHLNWLEKITALFAWGLAGAIFLSVGWFAMAPADPLGPVSLMSRADWPVMWVGSIALACVAAALATAVAGRLLPDIGTFAVAIGIIAVTSRGGSVNALLVTLSEAMQSPPSRLSLVFANETLGWIAVGIAALLASAATMRWCHPAHRRPPRPSGHRPFLLAGVDVPKVGRLFADPASIGPTPVAVGVQHMLVVAVAGFALITLFSQGVAARAVSFSQSCFVVGLGVALAAYLADRVRPVHSALWSVLGAWMIAIAGYLWASVRSGGDMPLTMMPSHFLRILPIQFVFVGTAAAVMTHWYRPEVVDGKSKAQG